VVGINVELYILGSKGENTEDIEHDERHVDGKMRE